MQPPRQRDGSGAVGDSVEADFAEPVELLEDEAIEESEAPERQPAGHQREAVIQHHSQFTSRVRQGEFVAHDDNPVDGSEGSADESAPLHLL